VAVSWKSTTMASASGCPVCNVWQNAARIRVIV
jgi:hypothetical protein